MHRAEHFAIYELVPPDIHAKYGDFAHHFLDERALRVIDSIRKRYGPMTINSYIWGGDRSESGLRTPDCKHYSPTSQHAFGRAFDLIPSRVTAQEIRDDLIDYSIGVLKLPHSINSITVEDNVSWLHVDIRNNNPGLNIFQP
ncbi:MAG: hypothetical protein ACPH3C_03060 [Glaciecola sp.]